MANNLDKTQLYPYLQSFGYTEQAINQALRKAPIEYQGALRRAYGKDFKSIRTELTKKDKDYLNGKALKWLTDELDRTMPYTKEDNELLKHWTKVAGIKTYEGIIYLLKFGYINNKKFSMQRIYGLINPKGKPEKVSEEKLKLILGDAKKKEQFINKMNNILENKKKRLQKEIIDNLTTESVQLQQSTRVRR